MAKRVAIIAPPFIKIPPKKQGGTERIVEETIEGLYKKGYKITLFGAGEYKGKAKFVRIFKKPISEIEINRAIVEASRDLRLEVVYIASVIREIIKRNGQFDVILNHMRGECLLLPLSRFIKAPIVSILHLPLFKEMEELISSYKNPNIVTISNSQRMGFNKINYLSTVYNGIKVEDFKFNNSPKDYFLTMGAIGEHKNPKEAILAAKKTRYKLILAGGKKREPYFSKEILPLIDGKKIKYVGEVGGKKRIDLFREAKALLFPIKWQEPFGLVMIEAMACGTPVIAYPAGAVREVIENKRTGFIVKNINQMVQAMNKIHLINRKKCRQRVEQKFSLQKMVDDYEIIIKKLTK